MTRHFCRFWRNACKTEGWRYPRPNPLVEALKMLENESYDAVLLDLMMPEMGGIEALQIMRKKQPEIQVIFVTGHPSVSKGVEAIKLGAMDFIPKPVDMNELTEKIHHAKASRMILVEKRSQEKIRKILTDKGW